MTRHPRRAGPGKQKGQRSRLLVSSRTPILLLLSPRQTDGPRHGNPPSPIPTQRRLEGSHVKTSLGALSRLMSRKLLTSPCPARFSHQVAVTKTLPSLWGFLPGRAGSGRTSDLRSAKLGRQAVHSAELERRQPALHNDDHGPVHRLYAVTIRSCINTLS